MESNMPLIGSTGDLPQVLASAVIIALVTAVLALTLGERIARKRKITAVLMCGAALPMMCVVAAIAQFWIIPRGDSVDGPAMLAVALISLAAFSLPVTMLTSVVVILLRTKPRSMG